MSIVSSREAVAEPLVALTFDDGPWPQTPDILDLLRGITATAPSSCWASRSRGARRSSPARWRRATRSATTRSATRTRMRCTDDELAHDIARCQRLLGHAPELFRPPYGEEPLRCARIAEARMLPTTVLWSIDPSRLARARPVRDRRDHPRRAGAGRDRRPARRLAARHVHPGRPHADGRGAADRAARDRPRSATAASPSASFCRPDRGRGGAILLHTGRCGVRPTEGGEYLPRGRSPPPKSTTCCGLGQETTPRSRNEHVT